MNDTNKTLQQFFEYLEIVKNVSVHTLRNYRIDLKHFFNSHDDHFQKVDKFHIRKYLADLADQGLKKRTIVRRLSAIRSFYKFLHRNALISTNPLDQIEGLKLDKPIPKALSYEEVQCFLDQPDSFSYLGFRDKTILELFYSSGLRVNELVLLNRKDIDFSQKLIRIKGKGKKERIVPITSYAAKYLDDYLSNSERYINTKDHKLERDHEAVFLNRWGKRITTRSVDRLFRKYLLQSGLSGDITPHTIRHTIATHWLENGMDLKTIQKILGHATLMTTTIYTKVSTKLKQDVYDKAHPLAKENQEGL